MLPGCDSRGCSLARMLRTWAATVRSLRVSCTAICWLVRPLATSFRNFHLACRDFGCGGQLAACAASRELVDKSAGDRRMQGGVTPVHIPHGPDQVVGAQVFQHIAGGASPDGGILLVGAETGEDRKMRAWGNAC